MPFKNKILFASFLTLAAFSAVPSQAQDKSLSKADVEKIVAEYLQKNPDVILNSLESYRVQQQKDFQEETSKKIQENMSLLTGPDLPSVGPADADVTIIEFFDYNCGYCKRALDDIQDLTKQDKKVRVVFKEMPILSPGSADAAKWALAAHKQGKYFEYHSALMKSREQKTVAEFKKLAKDVGLDVAKLEKDAASPDVEKQLVADLTIAREIGIQGTPAFIINGELSPGYLGLDGLKENIAAVRAKKKG